MELTAHDWFFILWLVIIWFVLSFFMLMLYAFWEDRKKNKYRESMFTVKDIFIGILFAPFTIVCGILYIIMWFIMRVLHFEDIADWLSDFMNKPLRFGKRDKDE